MNRNVDSDQHAALQEGMDYLEKLLDKVDKRPLSSTSSSVVLKPSSSTSSISRRTLSTTASTCLNTQFPRQASAIRIQTAGSTLGTAQHTSAAAISIQSPVQCSRRSAPRPVPIQSVRAPSVAPSAMASSPFHRGHQLQSGPLNSAPLHQHAYHSSPMHVSSCFRPQQSA